VTPLQFEEMDGKIYIAAAMGLKADWIRNIQANPKVEVRVKSQRYSGFAEVYTDIKVIADFLDVRLQRHPRMVGAILRARGIGIPTSRRDLEEYARQITLVVITPD